MIFLDPQQQRAGIMQRQTDSRVLLYQRKEGIVRILVTLFENVLEITCGLVGVNDEYDLKSGQGLVHEAHLSSYPERRAAAP